MRTLEQRRQDLMTVTEYFARYVTRIPDHVIDAYSHVAIDYSTRLSREAREEMLERHLERTQAKALLQ